MAHEILENDVQVGLQMAWHGLTIVVDKVTREVAFPFELRREAMTSQRGIDATKSAVEAFLALGKAYQDGGKGVTKARFAAASKQATEALDVLAKSKVGGYSVFVSDDNDTVVGRPMADTYEALSNERFWDICQTSLAGTGAVIESAGTLNNRARRFLTIKLNDDATEIGGRKFLNRISMIDAIDGTAYFHAVNTSICVVCANTARSAIGDMQGEFRFRLKHTKNFPSRIDRMQNQIESMLGVQAQFNAALDMAANEPLNESNARNLFAGWLGTDAEELSTRAKNTVDRLVQLHRGGAGNRGETLLDGISAVTDFYSHESAGGEEKPGFRWKQHLSSEHGAGAKAKTDFLSALFLTEKGKVQNVNRDNIATMQRRGASLLAIASNN